MSDLTKIQIRRGSPEQWSAANPILSIGEIGIEISTSSSRYKIGDGVKHWNDDTLPFFYSGNPITISSTAVSVHNADKTDVHGIINTEDLLYFSSAKGIYLSLTSGTGYTAGLPLSGGTMTGHIVLHTTPTQNFHPATKLYVDELREYTDNLAAGIVSKPSVLAATTANLDATYSNGTSGVGATLTANANGAFPLIDGVQVYTTTGSRGVLVKNQSSSLQNGRYNLTTQGDSENPWVLTRCGLCDEADEIPGAYIFVTDGATNGQTGWTLHVEDPQTFVVGTDAITAFQFSGVGTYSAGTGLKLEGTTFSFGTTATLNELNDVIIDTPTTNQFLRYGSTGNGWVNQTVDIVNPASVVYLTTTQSITGRKTMYLPTMVTPIDKALTVSTTGISVSLATSGNIYYGTVSGNFALRLGASVTNSGTVTTSLSSIVATGDTVTYTAMIEQNATPRSISSLSVDGTVQTIKWQNGFVPVPIASTTSVYNFAIIKTAAAYSVLGSMTTFG